MQRKRHSTSVNEQIRDEATEWFIRFCEDEVDGSACEEFDAWLRVSPQHVRAYLDISAFWVAAGTMTRTPALAIWWANGSSTSRSFAPLPCHKRTAVDVRGSAGS